MKAEQGVAGYSPQVASPQNADVRQNTIMKTLSLGLLLLLCATTHAAVTNELLICDVASRMYPTDYGTLTLSAIDFTSTLGWDGESDPPLSVAQAIDSVKLSLPPITEDRWMLDSIIVENFDGKGWCYLVTFKHNSSFTKDQRHYIITKHYCAAVLMDGRVLLPSKEPI